jgi:hypothetical protein
MRSPDWTSLASPATAAAGTREKVRLAFAIISIIVALSLARRLSSLVGRSWKTNGEL